MLVCYHSNRLEILLASLIKDLNHQDSGSDPFTPELIVVPHPGMGRWLSHNIAIHTGIAANFRFITPANFFWQLLRAWHGNLAAHPAWGHDNLHWSIMRQLPKLIQDPAFIAIQRYLDRNNTELRLFQLARRIADLYEHYLLFRPEWVLAWENGADEHWQALLWRDLLDNNPAVGTHWGRLLHTWQTTAQSPPAKPLPKRINSFAINRLPPIYAEIIKKLAPYTQVHIWHLNPTRSAYSTQDIDGKPSRCALGLESTNPHGRLNLNNPLLATLGHKHQALLQQFLALTEVQQDNFITPGEGTLLQRIQSDILELRDRRPASSAERPLLDHTDLSIQIHSCHSPLREVQVLRDRLLQLFTTIPHLTPRDVVVMTPDIDLYSQYIEAVFGTMAGTQRMPWIIAKRRLGAAAQSLFAALELLLDLPNSRFEASEILSLLQVPAVQQRCGLDQIGIIRIHTWVQEAGIRWGIDAPQRAELGLPAEAANTWDFGLQRLRLGMALALGPQQQPYNGVLPYPDMQSNDVVYMEILQGFLERLIHWRQRLQGPRPLREWHTTLYDLCVDMFLPCLDEEKKLLQSLHTGLDSMAVKIPKSGLATPVSGILFRYLIQGIATTRGSSQQLFSGQITFCTLEAMSAIPFRVVCLLGINGADFPRRQRSPAFDLMATTPRHGDPSRRRDDNARFLDAILAARDCLYISYLGRDIHDNSPKPPSVVVSDLLDYITQTYQCQELQPADGGDPQPHILVQHPLQPFSRRVFDGIDPRLQSYAREWLEAQVGPAPGYFATAAPLDTPDMAWRTLNLDELIKCLACPARYFLTRRLGLKLPRDNEIQADAEPFALDNLQLHNLGQTLLPLVQAGWEDTALLERVRAAGTLPHAAIGTLVLQDTLHEVRTFADRLAAHIASPADSLEVDLTINGFRLQGQLRELRTTGLFTSRFGKLRGKDCLELWVRHLVLCALHPAAVALNSLYVAKDRNLQLSAVADPQAVLSELLDWRWQALMTPLPFFPNIALEWYEQGADIEKLHKRWYEEKTEFSQPPSEFTDIAAKIAFRGVNPLDAKFAAITARIFEPLLAHSKWVPT